MRRAEYGAQTQSASPDRITSGNCCDYHTNVETGDSSYPFQIKMLMADYDDFHYPRWLYQDWLDRSEG